MVDLRKFQYVPGTVLDVTTFEVKTAEAIDVLAVYEVKWIPLSGQVDLAPKNWTTYMRVWT